MTETLPNSSPCGDEAAVFDRLDGSLLMQEDDDHPDWMPIAFFREASDSLPEVQVAAYLSSRLRKLASGTGPYSEAWINTFLMCVEEFRGVEIFMAEHRPEMLSLAGPEHTPLVRLRALYVLAHVKQLPPDNLSWSSVDPADGTLSSAILCGIYQTEGVEAVSQWLHKHVDSSWIVRFLLLHIPLLTEIYPAEFPRLIDSFTQTLSSRPGQEQNVKQLRELAACLG